MRPVKFKRLNGGKILITWDDGRDFALPLQFLRDRCPCASCAGESVLWHEYKPSGLNILTPGKYELKSAEVVGDYAMALTWGDGHSTGIYAFDYLRRICIEQNRTPVAGHAEQE